MSTSTTSAPLPAVTDATFATEVAAGTGLVAVEFWAAWCAPCRIMTPVVETVAAANAGRLRVLQMDADANPATTARLGVRALPTLLVFRDGELLERLVGAVPQARLQERLDRLIAG